MNNSLKALLLAAAGSGLMSGTAMAAPVTPMPSGGSAFSPEKLGKAPVTYMADDTTMDKHSCKGKNSCKGKGGCNTGDNGCKAKNSCKGKGGCKTTS